MSIEFDPSKFKNIQEMPKEEQKNFVDVKGGFVGEKAVRYEDAAGVLADRMNKERAEYEKHFDSANDFFGLPSSAEVKNYLGIPPTSKRTPMDVLHQVAKEEDQKRYGGRLKENEALVYQQYATDIEGKGFSEQASPEAYGEAEKLLRQFQDPKFDWLGVDWEKVDFKNLKDIKNVEDRVRLAAKFMLQEAKEKDPSLFAQLVEKLGGVSKATDILEGAAGVATIVGMVSSAFLGNMFTGPGGAVLSFAALMALSNPDFHSDLERFILKHSGASKEEQEKYEIYS
ncbi:MAG: hypothetical protein HZB10_02735 [Candidatus Yonathbacteria bacterium]|nr:hypothetical protein [Candidatus Yonathbacteria bacterium]